MIAHQEPDADDLATVALPVPGEEAASSREAYVARGDLANLGGL